MTRNLVPALVLLLALLAPATASAQSSIPPASPNFGAGSFNPADFRMDSSLKSASHSYVVFVGGIEIPLPLIEPPNGDPVTLFAHVRERATSILSRDTQYLYYSYCDLGLAGVQCFPSWLRPRGSDGLLLNQPTYAKGATHQPLINQASGLNFMIGAILQTDPSASIGLVAYSLGGPVAYAWAANYETGHVRHILTLDSPVGGVAPGVLNALISGVVLEPAAHELKTPATVSGWLGSANRAGALDKVAVTEVLNDCDPVVNGQPLSNTCGLSAPSDRGEVIGYGLQHLPGSIPPPSALVKMQQQPGTPGLYRQSICARFDKWSATDPAPWLHSGLVGDPSLVNFVDQGETLAFVLANHGAILGPSDALPCPQADDLIDTGLRRLAQR